MTALEHEQWLSIPVTKQFIAKIRERRDQSLLNVRACGFQDTSDGTTKFKIGQLDQLEHILKLLTEVTQDVKQNKP